METANTPAIRLPMWMNARSGEGVANGVAQPDGYAQT